MKLGHQAVHFGRYVRLVCSEGLYNRLRISDLVLRKSIVFSGKISAQNFLNSRKLIVSFSEGKNLVKNVKYDHLAL